MKLGTWASRLERSLGELGAVAALAVPALGVVAVDPLISLVDTACIGRVSTAQLAALAPNGTIFNMVFQVFTFIGVSVTNVMAKNSPNAPGISDLERKARIIASQKLLCYSLVLATFCGLSCSLTCMLFGTPLLRFMGTAPELLPLALPYLLVRSLSSPAVMIMNASQGAFLGQQDTTTPLKIFMTTAAINAALDWYLVVYAGFGIIGCAFATAFCQYMAATAFVYSLHKAGKEGKSARLLWMGLPTRAEVKPFVDVGWKLLSRTLFKMIAYAAITAAATKLETNVVASHQIALQMFWLLSFLPEPLSMAAQSLIARDSTDSVRVRKMTWLLVHIASIVSGILGVLVGCGFYYGSQLFTPELEIIQGVRELVLPGVLSIMLCTYVMQCDGIYIGSSDFDHLPRTNLVACSVVGGMLYWIQGNNLGLVWVWWAMATFFLTRLLQHVIHAAVHYKTSAFGHYVRHDNKVVVERAVSSTYDKVGQMDDPNTPSSATHKAADHRRSTVATGTLSSIL